MAVWCCSVALLRAVVCVFNDELCFLVCLAKRVAVARWHHVLKMPACTTQACLHVEATGTISGRIFVGSRSEPKSQSKRHHDLIVDLRRIAN